MILITGILSVSLIMILIRYFGLKKQEDYLKDSVANISHDLRTPLTVILGHIQILEKYDMPDDQRERLKVISSKAVRMKELVDSFYDLSVLDSGGDNPDPEKINLSNMIFDYLADFASALEERKIEPEVKLPEKSVFIEQTGGCLKGSFRIFLLMQSGIRQGY